MLSGGRAKTGESRTAAARPHSALSGVRLGALSGSGAKTGDRARAGVRRMPTGWIDPSAREPGARDEGGNEAARLSLGPLSREPRV